MNKSLKYGMFALMFFLGTLFVLPQLISEQHSYVIYYFGLALGIITGIIAFIKGIKEIRQKENKYQAISGFILGLITGILPPLVWLVAIALIIAGGAH